MSWNKPPVVSRVKGKTLEELRANLEFGPVLRNVFPLTGQAKPPRTTQRTLGEGTFGRVNLEALNEGNVATKYFKNTRVTLCDNLAEVSVLKYLYGQPNITPYLGLTSTNVTGAELPFPAILLGKATSDLDNSTKQTSWDDIYSVCIQVLRGYYIMHSLGIVHRDTKPKNLLLTSLGEVWISDFGESKYIDSHIPAPSDDYPGTIRYAAPELLIKYDGHSDAQPVDYIKSDVWAVGSTLYNIVTGTSFLTADSIPDCIEKMIVQKGTPQHEDGIVYSLFTTWDEKDNVEQALELKTGKKTVDPVPDAIISDVNDKARFKTAANQAQIAQMANVISAMMQYDPAKRPTIGDALQMPGMPGLPPALQRPSLTPEYTQISALPNDITPDMLDILMNWLYELLRSQVKNNNVKPFVMDRTGTYLFAFLQFFKEDPFCQKKNLRVIGICAYILARCFFAADLTISLRGYSFFLTPPQTEKDLLECITMYLKSNIQFYGRTFLDELLLTRPTLTPEEIETYGLLNYECFQKNIFLSYIGKLDTLRDKLIEYVTDGRFPPKLYLQTTFQNKNFGVGNSTEKIIQDFVKYITPSEGGRRRTARRKSRRVKRRRHNKTLKVRNG